MTLRTFFPGITLLIAAGVSVQSNKDPAVKKEGKAISFWQDGQDAREIVDRYLDTVSNGNLVH